LNIAEGAGEFSTNEKIRFYRMAKRSATECAGIVDVCWRLNLVNDKLRAKSRELLLRIVSMLLKWRAFLVPDIGHARGHGNERYRADLNIFKL
jgi:four helix bundle protein